MHLLLDCSHRKREQTDVLCEDIDVIRKLSQIYHLTMETNVHPDTLGNILIHLPALDSLQIPCLPLSQPETLSDDEKPILQPIPSTTRITKVYLETVYDIEEVFFLMEQCSQLTYLKVHFVKNLDEKTFVRLILMKIKINSQYQLRLLSFHVPQTDDHMLKTLKKIIDGERLLTDYSIKHIDDEIFLQWI